MSCVGCRVLGSLHNAGLQQLQGIKLTAVEPLDVAGSEAVLRPVVAAKPRLAK